MAQQYRSTIAYAKTRVTQQERVETDLEHGIYERNKVVGSYTRITIDVKD